MKYLQTGGFQSHPLMRLTLLWTLVFVCGLWATSAAMYLSRMSLTPASVERYYLGSPEDYSQPRSAASMLEVTHVHLPIMAVVLLLLTHLMIFAPYSDRAKRWFISTAFLSALLQEAAGWLVRFVHPGFAVLKVAAFLSFQGCLLFLIVGLAGYLLRGAKTPKPARSRHAEPASP